MSTLFQPYVIGEMEIRNRFMRSATTSAYADTEGVVRQERSEEHTSELQ